MNIIKTNNLNFFIAYADCCNQGVFCCHMGSAGVGEDDIDLPSGTSFLALYFVSDTATVRYVVPTDDPQYSAAEIFMSQRVFVGVKKVQFKIDKIGLPYINII